VFSFIQVLMLTTALIGVMVAGLVHMVFRHEDDRSAKFWVAGSLLMSGGMLLLVFRKGLPDVLAFPVTNFIMLYAMALYRDSFWGLARPAFKASPIVLWLCIADGLLIWGLKEAGYQSYLSFTAAIAWSLMHLWMLYSLNRLRREINNPYFTVAVVLTGAGLVFWLVRVYLTAGFNIAMATDATLINLVSLSLVHFTLIAQQIVYLVVRLTDEKSKKQRIQELSDSIEKMWSERQTLLEARQEERESLLRDVHDGFGSKLATARMLADRGRLDPKQFADYLQEIMADLHLVVDTLSHSDTTLAEALADMRYRFERRLAGASLQVHWQIELEGLPAQNPRTVLHQLRVVQEALNNALRHAGAKNIRISARYDASGQSLVVSVVDDGSGLDENVRQGHGLNNMLTRARESGGQLSIKNLEPGTEVSLIVPMPPAVRAAGQPSGLHLVA
jgi:signal transduction histidine kinase